MSSICYVCGETDETRPYGEGKKPICHLCMTSTPEREAEGKKQIAALFAQIERTGGVPMITEQGIVRAPAHMVRDALGGTSKGERHGLKN